MEETLKRIEDVLEKEVRPSLRAHGGEIAIDHLEDGVLYVKLLGQCAGCPSADLTNETIVEAEVVKALPELVHTVVVVQTVSDELWEPRASGPGLYFVCALYQRCWFQDWVGVMAK